MVHRLIVSYDGRPFAGWQRQPAAPTVQGAVEAALSDLLDEDTVVYGAGRTDAGVHAFGQAAHLFLRRPFPAKGLVHGANHRLCPEIRLLAAHRMPEGFHARKCALGKRYVYRIHRGHVVPPTSTPFVHGVGQPLDLGAMERALRHLPGEHDFSAFALAGGSHGQPRRRLFSARLSEHGREVRLTFYGQGFLRGMVRALAGTLIEVGRGSRPADDLRRLLQPGHERCDAGVTAPAQGLCLEAVFYPPAWRPLEGYAG
ncbi:MAG: tRNA pseudouridine(38-40) synthase TruA [Acidobacteriota bacterium]